MNKKQLIDKLIDEAINSTDNVKRADAKPFLQTRINARLNKTKENVWWEKAGRFIGRPSIAIPGLAMLFLINFMVVLFNMPDSSSVATEQPDQWVDDEFSNSLAAVYDIENTEPQ